MRGKMTTRREWPRGSVHSDCKIFHRPQNASGRWHSDRSKSKQCNQFQTTEKRLLRFLRKLRSAI